MTSATKEPGDDRQLRTAWEETVIYEVHVKGFTQQHPDVPGDLRGRFGMHLDVDRWHDFSLFFL